MSFASMHNDYLDPDRHDGPVSNVEYRNLDHLHHEWPVEPRFEVCRTRKELDRCWGVYDRLEQVWVMKDNHKRRCTAKADELNRIDREDQ